VVDGVVHYCVTNMPGAVGRTSTYALCNVTLPWAIQIANLGAVRAAAFSRPIARAINIIENEVTNQAVAETFGIAYKARFEV
jgi:alanine dehydrogenase